MDVVENRQVIIATICRQLSPCLLPRSPGGTAATLLGWTPVLRLNSYLINSFFSSPLTSLVVIFEQIVSLVRASNLPQGPLREVLK